MDIQCLRTTTHVILTFEHVLLMDRIWDCKMGTACSTNPNQNICPLMSERRYFHNLFNPSHNNHSNHHTNITNNVNHRQHQIKSPDNNHDVESILSIDEVWQCPTDESWRTIRRTTSCNQGSPSSIDTDPNRDDATESTSTEAIL